LTTLAFYRLIPGMNISQNAKFALVIAEYPKNTYGENDKMKWEQFLGTAMSKFPQSKNTPTIHEGVWQIPLESDMPFLAKLCQRACEMDIHLRILFLDADPDWLHCPPPAEKPFAASVVESQRPDRRLQQ
jgi:hypothetical protein